MLINLNDGEVRKPIRINDGDKLNLGETLLFDAYHKAEMIPPAKFQNGGEIVLPAQSVTLLIFR